MKGKETKKGASTAPETEVVRKSLIMDYKHYHPEFNGGKTDKDREEQIQQMADFLETFLPCDKEEAVRVSTAVIDEIRILPVEEVKRRSEHYETIGVVINKVVGRTVLPDVLPNEDINV